MHRLFASRLEKEIVENGCTVEGCPDSARKMKYEELVKHLKCICEEIPEEVKCPILNCTAKFQKKNAEQHFKTCPLNVKECNVCHNKFFLAIFGAMG